MNIADGFRWLLGRETGLETRSDTDPSSLADLIARLGPSRTSVWRAASNREAMGVPAVFKAVSLISNTTGSLSMEAYRASAKLPFEDTPRIVIRPNPFTRPHVFWRDSAYYQARRGEIWWWTAKRDTDGSPMSLITIDPREIVVTENPRNLLRPIIEWRGVRMPNDDMTQITYLPDPANPLRGWGPLQACGAAVSVAVEAQEFAANFFAGNPSNTWIKVGFPVDATEAATFKEQWIGANGNLPKVTGPDVEDVKDVGTDPMRAQLSDARLFQNGEIALMFSMPPTLLNYAVQGSTITYQNVGQIADDFLRECLLPHYLEPMEQAMSDLLTRQTIGKFNTAALLRPDIKTRYDVYNIGIPLGVLTAEEARSFEGLSPGDVENRPVPFAAPQAIPSSLPIQTRTEEEPREVRCPNPECRKLYVSKATGYVGGRCWRTNCRTIIDDWPSGVTPRTQPIAEEPRTPVFHIVRTDRGADVIAEPA